LLENIFVAKYLHVSRLIGFHRPMHHVNPVREEISHRAATKVPEPTPVVILFVTEDLIGSAA